MCLTSFQRSLRVETLGRVAYAPMHELQKQRQRDVAAGDSDDTLFLLEHDAVLTLGKNSGAGHVLASAETLGQRGIEVIATGRGGDVTYHGPGQLVGYPIIHLQEEERDVRRFVTYLEESMIRTCKTFAIDARRIAGLRGIWVGDNKIGAVGVRLARWTTMHGFALNMTTDLRDFELIVPCGLHGKGVTSMRQELGEAPPAEEVRRQVVEHFAFLMDRAAYEAPATPARCSAGLPGAVAELAVMGKV